MIPEAAVEVLARILANEALFNADIEGYGWDSDRDSSDHFMPTARKKAIRYLEAAAPHMLAEAWEVGTKARRDYRGDLVAANPYRSTK